MNRLNTKMILPMLTAFFLISELMTRQAAASCSNTNFPAHRIVVSPTANAGDCTTITDALNQITNPSSTNTWTIQVMPGTYTEDVHMKSYVTLLGSGSGVTTIQAPTASNNAITIFVSSGTNIEISGFTLIGGTTGNAILVSNTIGGIKIIDNVITGVAPVQYPGTGINLSSSGVVDLISGNIIYSRDTGIYNSALSSSMIISGNRFYNNNKGIYNYQASPVIDGNEFDNNKESIYNLTSNAIISNNTIQVLSGNTDGISNNNNSAPTITGNTITSGGTPNEIVNNSSSPTILYNKLINSAGQYDIVNDANSAPNVSFNVYTFMSGANAKGHYNVKPDGTIIN